MSKFIKWLKKVRIVKYTFDNKVRYVLKQRHFLFWWWWVDCWTNSLDSWANTSFDTLEEAKANIKYWDGTKATEEIVYEQ